MIEPLNVPLRDVPVCAFGTIGWAPNVPGPYFIDQFIPFCTVCEAYQSSRKKDLFEVTIFFALCYCICLWKLFYIHDSCSAAKLSCRTASSAPGSTVMSAIGHHRTLAANSNSTICVLAVNKIENEHQILLCVYGIEQSVVANPIAEHPA
jgi:hypothetical protein